MTSDTFTATLFYNEKERKKMLAQKQTQTDGTTKCVICGRCNLQRIKQSKVFSKLESNLIKIK